MMRTLRIFLLAALVVVLSVACIGCSFGGTTLDDPENDRFVSYNCFGDDLPEDIRDEVRKEFFENGPGQVTIKPGDTFVSVQPPEVDGYKFVGWYEDVYIDDAFVETKIWQEGEPLPTDRDVNVYAVYEPLQYTITYYANGELIITEEYEGVTNLISSKLLDPDKLDIDSDWYFHHGYTVIYGLFANEELADIMSERDGFNYSSEYFFYCEIYTDEEMTQPLTEMTVTEDVCLYSKFVYAPVNFDYRDSEDAYVVRNMCGEVPGGVLELPATYAGLDVIAINDGAFYGSSYITEVILPSTIKRIGDLSFSASSIEKIYIPESVEYIGSSAFADCASLTTVDIHTTAVFDIDDVFANCNSIQYEQYHGAYYFGFRLMSAIEGYTGHVMIKPGCEKIPAGAFAGMLITELTIPTTVTEIGEGAFKDSTLASITFPASVTTIGAEAFANTKIVDITLPETITSLGVGVFKDCVLLTTYTINTAAPFSFSKLFENCSSLTGEEYGNAYYYGDEFIRPVSKDITWAVIKSGCTSLPANAFRDCTKLSKVYLPKTVKNVGSYAFYNVNSLYFAPYIESYTATSIMWDENALATIHPETGADLMYQRNTFPTSVLLDESGIAYAIESMKNYTGSNQNACVIYGCFTYATELTVAAEYNNQPVKVIYPNAFMDNDTLVDLTIESCYVVGSAAFWNATALKEITFKTCSQIGIRAFYGCASLEKVTFESEYLVFIGKQAFEGCDMLNDVKVDNVLIAWNEDLSENVEIAANTNIASALKGAKLYWCFADEDVTQAQLQALLSQLAG